MRTLLAALILCLASLAQGQSVVLHKAHGYVAVRHGVAESWNIAAPGDVLKPDDSMRTGKNASAVLIVNPTKRLVIPADVIVDISDIRDLSQEELMLKLTMEKVRASSYEWKNSEMNIPNAAIVHGYPPAQNGTLAENPPELGTFEFNGVKVLYDNGYFSTSALKAMDVLRRYPSLGEKFENRLLVAEALEQARLRGEALNEYVALSQSGGLTAPQKDILNARIDRLRKLSE